MLKAPLKIEVVSPRHTVREREAIKEVFERSLYWEFGHDVKSLMTAYKLRDKDTFQTFNDAFERSKITALHATKVVLKNEVSINVTTD